MAYELTKDQQDKALKLFKQFDGDLHQIVKLVFQDNDEKGSTVRGRALRSFYSNLGMKYNPKVAGVDKLYYLTDREKEFLANNYNDSMTKQEAGTLLWPSDSKKMSGFFQSSKYLALCKFINNAYKDINPDDNAIGKHYSPPRATGSLVKAVNRATLLNLDHTNLNSVQKKNLEKLSTYLHSPRFIQIMNAYNKTENRVLFESELIRCSWEKTILP